MNFHIMKMSVVQSMLDSGEWDKHYTTADVQKSDDGEFIAIVGKQSDVVKSFATVRDMAEYCYSNGWTEPDYEEV